jgi:malyl-CoA/(S)-citramalyl-CoA lyase
MSLPRSASLLRSHTTHFLPRFSSAKVALSPATIGGNARMPSPPGRSILITLAPASASIKAASGPGSKVVKSRTNRPDKGCMYAPLDPTWRSSCIPLNGRQTFWKDKADVKPPRHFYAPLAIGAPAPLRDLPVRLERMIHFVPPHMEKLRAKVPELVRQVDVVLGNLEDAIPVDAKEAARKGFIEMAKAVDYGETGLWTRINALNSPWALDDVTEIVGAVGDKLDVIMLPKVDGPWDIHYLDQLLGQLEARHKIKKPILIHAILETAQGVNNVEAIAIASPRMHGMSLGPADLAASRAMKTTRVGGGHPEYKVLADAQGDSPRASAQQDLWHYTIAKMVDACAAAGIKPFYGPFGDFADAAACEAQFRNAFLMGCLGAWSLHPSQIAIAKKVFSPDPAEVAFAKKIVAAMPDGAGAVMIDGKMQDDATWKQAKVLLDLARLVAAKDPEMGARYGL